MRQRCFRRNALRSCATRQVLMSGENILVSSCRRRSPAPRRSGQPVPSLRCIQGVAALLQHFRGHAVGHVVRDPVHQRVQRDSEVVAGAGVGERAGVCCRHRWAVRPVRAWLVGGGRPQGLHPIEHKGRAADAVRADLAHALLGNVHALRQRTNRDAAGAHQAHDHGAGECWLGGRPAPDLYGVKKCRHAFTLPDEARLSSGAEQRRGAWGCEVLRQHAQRPAVHSNGPRAVLAVPDPDAFVVLRQLRQ